MVENNSIPSSFKIQFTTNPDPEIKSCCAVIHKNEIRQRIMVLLRTELGDISGNEEYGTELYQQKHLDILSEDVQDSVRRIVLGAVSGILEDPNVVVERAKSKGPFFCQNLDIHIYDGKNEVYNFDLEGTL